MKQKFLNIIFFFLISFSAYPQDTLPKMELKTQTNSLNKSAEKLSQSLEKGKSEVQIAAQYEALADELLAKGEQAKAVEYLTKARDIYLKNNNKKASNKEKISEISLKIAAIQESQKKYDKAIFNYQVASENTKDESAKQIYGNKAAFLEEEKSPQAQSEIVRKNVKIAEQSNRKADKKEAYEQFAEVNLKLNQKEAAIENFGKALKNASDLKEKNELNKKIADVYLSDNQIDKAVEINKNLIIQAQKSADTKAEAEQMRRLAELYFQKNENEKAAKLLEKSYEISVKNSHTNETVESLEKLTNFYEKEKKYDKSINYYKDFLKNFNDLVKSDSALVDLKSFQIIEEKIKQLEKERDLQKKLISQKNIINYILIALIIIALTSTFFIIKSLVSIKKKNKKIALQSLRREMNPHFIFNSLNSVNQFIAQNNELEANKYLSSYSKLMRKIMENSNRDFIKLSAEIEQIKEYLDLEKLRFKEKFDYEISLDKKIDAEAASIPNMIIQPHLENAIWHGLRYKDEKGFLKLSIFLENGKLFIKIEDNGIGLSKSQAVKTENQKQHVSRGLKNTEDRIALLNSLYKTEIKQKITEKTSAESGVIVQIEIKI